MAEPARGEREGQGRRETGRVALALTLLFVLAAITVSTGLVVYTAWLHDLENGSFAVLFGVLSAKATLSWLAWKDQDLLEQRRAGDGPKHP